MVSVKKMIIFLGVLGLILLGASGGYMYTSKYTRDWNGRICPKCFVNEVDISGKNRDEAILLLTNSVSHLYNNKITIRGHGREYVQFYKDLNPRYNIEEVVDNELRHGQTSSFLTRIRQLKSSSERKSNLQLQYDDGPIRDLIDKFEKDITRLPKNAYIKFNEPGQIAVVDEVPGARVDKEALYRVVISKIDGTGKNIEVDAEIEEIKPAVTGEELRKINTLIASSSTYYGGSPAGRAANIELTTRMLSGKLLMPGEVFSFNEVTGPRIETSGYQTAPVIIKNKLVDGIGGGVCQVSTTLYNAIIRCNIRSMQRLNHSLAPAYIAPGFDATVASNIDYKFKNTLNYPILIEGFTKDGRIHFNVYSHPQASEIKYKLITDVYETAQPETVYIKDPTLPKGAIAKEESPHTGYKVKVYLVGYKGSREVSRQLVSHDVYTKVDAVFRIGVDDEEKNEMKNDDVHTNPQEKPLKQLQEKSLEKNPEPIEEKANRELQDKKKSKTNTADHE
jgi:vancomycin resistance protein YoaR